MTFEKIILNNIFRNLKVYTGYLLSSIFSVTTFYIFSIIYNNPSFQGHYDRNMFLIFKEMIYVITIFFIIYFLKMFVKSKKREFGIFLILGISKKQVRKVLFIENTVIGILSITIGIFFGIAFSKFFMVIISSILGIEELKFYFSLKVVGIIIVRYLVLFCIIPISIGKIMKIKNIIELINYKKQETTKIKVSLIKSIISIGIIIFGYFLVLNSNIYNILSVRILIILGLFVLGNYLFFKYVINYMIYLISKSKKIYLNKINFFFLSSLKYRVYDNIYMLFMVTILLAVSFTSIGGVYVQKSVLKRDAVKNSPFSLNYFINDYFKYNKDEKFIDNVLKSNNIKYSKIKLHIVKSSDLNLIKQSEYNKISPIIKRDRVNLGKKQAVLVPNYESITESERKLIGKKLKIDEHNELIIKGNLEGCITFKGILRNTFIVSDEEFNRIYDKNSEKMFIGYEVDKWEYTKKLTENIMEQYKKTNHQRNIKNYFISRVSIYDIEKTNNDVFLYFIFFVGGILYLAAIGFMNYKFYVEIKQEHNKYRNIISLGLTFKELKKIISREMVVILFIPYIIGTIDAIFAYRILYLVYEIPILKSIFQIVSVFFIINLAYFFIWRLKSINLLRDSD